MTEHCEVFKREEDVEAMREFTGWLRSGGMDALREMKQCSDEYKAIKQAGFSAMVRLFWLGIVFVIGLGAWTILEAKK